jgi:hypothetical protein
VNEAEPGAGSPLIFIIMDLQIPKERWQSSEYLAFIRKQACLIPHGSRFRKGEAHHTISRRWVTGSDANTIPLCHECHMTAHHTVGVETFLKEHHVNQEKAIARLHDAFLREKNIAWDQVKHPSFESLLDAHGLSTRYAESKKVNRKYPFTKGFKPIEERPELWEGKQ